MAINTAVFGGNITQEIKRFGSEENPAIGFNIAVNVPIRQDGEWVEDTLFVSCVMFGKRVIKLSEIMHKGMNVTVCGSLKPERYKNKDGVVVNTFGMTVSEIGLPPKPKTENDNSNPWG